MCSESECCFPLADALPSVVIHFKINSMTDNAQEGGSTFSMNTVRLYGPKIKEWNAYCEAKEFTDG